MAKKKQAKAEEVAPEAAEAVAEGQTMTRIKLTSAACDPLPIYINGLGMKSLRVGQEHDVNDDMLAALDSADASYEVVAAEGGA